VRGALAIGRNFVPGIDGPGKTRRRLTVSVCFAQKGGDQAAASTAASMNLRPRSALADRFERVGVRCAQSGKETGKKRRDRKEKADRGSDSAAGVLDLFSPPALNRPIRHRVADDLYFADTPESNGELPTRVTPIPSLLLA
jgi:hypothetical protein